MALEEVKKSAKKTTPKKEIKKDKPAKKKTTTQTKKSPKKKTTAKKSTPVLIQEENSYSRTIIAAILIAIIFLAGYIFVYLKGDLSKDNSNYKPTADEISFKEDYESLNGSTYSDGTKATEVNIIDDNNIVYISMNEAVEILDGKSGVIYFGYAGCEYSRNAVPVLLNAMQSSKLDKIYYVNLRPEENSLTGVGTKENDLRDEYTLNEKNKAKRTKDAEDIYYELLTSLASYLDDYNLKTSKGKTIPTGEKRLNTPTVVAVKNGEIVGFHQKTLEEHKLDKNKVLPKLTKEQEKELLKEYTKVISEYLK